MKFGENVLRVNTHRLASRIFDLTSKFQDGRDPDCDVMSRGKLLLPDEWTRSFILKY